MFDYISVQFPQVDLPPVTVYSAYLYQEKYKHEIFCLTFKDWGVLYDSVKAGSPIQITLAGTGESREFYGYVHHVSATRTPGKDFIEVTAISSSYTMKKATQTVYRDISADKIITKIAKSHGFISYTVPHPRVYEQVAQSGQSDWELMVRLAKQCGYSLRTQNTELYFQPLLEDYTKYRSEAPVFIMGDIDSPNGTDIYSFTPMVGESIPYKDGIKSAVAISGVDQFNKAAVKHTKAVRNKKTKLKFQQEFFDKFDTHVVATDSLIARHEAEAAESLNSSFAYRAEVEVIGTPRLRPDLPIFLDGLGKTFSGYWTILKAEHKVVETQRNVYTYTTILEVGTDSLGEAQVWTDNKRITSPNPNGIRTIIPNVRQTKVKPNTALIKRSVTISPQITGNFGTLKNRSNQPNGNITVVPPVWRSTTTSLESVVPEVRKAPFIIARLQKSGQL